MASPKRKFLDLNQKVEAIKLLDSGKPAYKVAEIFGVGKTQIQSLRKRKADVLNEYENNAPGSQKRQRRITGNEDINNLCVEWFKDATKRRINVTGPMLKERALVFAKDLDNDTFKASNGWLESFIKRNNLSFGNMSGERGDVNKQTVSDWKLKLPNLCRDYEEKNIFNMDETGLFYKDTSRKTFHEKGNDCAGGKRSKERITVALCSSVLGEKFKPLIIGKARQPRCFKGISPDNLPVIYRNNKKAWMTGKLYEEWLSILNRKMKRQKRKILLFVDNAPCHPETNFSNVEVKFFPPNTTSLTQPMDQGIIQTTKLKFRKRQLFHLIKEMERQPHSCGSDLLQQITILDAIYWLNNSWTEVLESTITKCFRRCGFVKEAIIETESAQNDDENEEDDDDNIPLAALKMSREIFGCEFNELIEVDRQLSTYSTDDTTEWNQPATELLKHFNGDENTEVSDSEDEENSNGKLYSKADANNALNVLKMFAQQNNSVNLLTHVSKAEEELSKMISSSCCKQAHIQDFFIARN